MKVLTDGETERGIYPSVHRLPTDVYTVPGLCLSRGLSQSKGSVMNYSPYSVETELMNVSVCTVYICVYFPSTSHGLAFF